MKGELAEIGKMFKQKDIIGLRELSNRIIEEVFVSQDKEMVEVAVVAYSLSKIIGKPHFTKSPKWKKFEEHFLGEIEKKVPPNVIISEIMADVAEIDRNLGNYMNDTIQHTRAKQASRLYALGLSLSQASEICGADKAEVLRYVGLTKIAEREQMKSKSLQERMKTARKVFW